MADLSAIQITLAPQFELTITHDMGGVAAGFTIVAGISRSTGGGAGNEYLNAEKVKLAGIETAATADQTGAEIKALYEVEPSAFTDAQFTKLAGIEAAATADQSNAEIKTGYELNVDTNAYTDAEKTKLAGIEALATADQSNAEIRTAVEAATDSNVFTDADHTKLNAIEAGATADQSNTEIRTAVEAATDSNVFTDADHTKLNSVESGATADQSNGEIETAYNTQVAKISAGEITAGTEVAVRRVSPADLKAVVLAHETPGGGSMSDAEVETAYNNRVAKISAGEITAGTEVAVRRSSPADIKSMIDTHATGTMSDAAIKTAYENNTNTNEYDDAEQTKLAGIETAATADQSNSEIETAYNTQVGKVSAGEITTGTETAVRRYSPADIVAIIAAHESGGGSTTEVNERTASGTLALTDAGDIVEMNVATANVLTIPDNATVAFPIGTIITVSMMGVGITSITAAASVTLNGVSIGSGAMIAQYDGVSLYKRATNVWVVQGAIGVVA